MASVNYLKIKTRTDLRANIRHCNKSDRLENEHSNTSIDKSLTSLNKQLYNETVSDTTKRFKDRITALDKTTNTNKRKDRVEAFALNIPIPHEIKNKEAFFNDICKLFQKEFGEKNLINAYLHVDEIHDYIDTATMQVRTSLAHIHCFVIPEVEGKLKGKKFSSVGRMNEVDLLVDNLCREKYKTKFRTGTKTKSRATVEELKEASEEAQKSLMKDLKDKTPVEAKKTLIGDNVTLKKSDFEKLQKKAVAYDNLTERDTMLHKEIEKAHILISQKKEILSKIEDYEDIEEAYIQMQYALKQNKDFTSLIAENSNLQNELDKQKRRAERWEEFANEVLNKLKNTPFFESIARMKHSIEKANRGERTPQKTINKDISL